MTALRVSIFDIEKSLLLVVRLIAYLVYAFRYQTEGTRVCSLEASMDHRYHSSFNMM